MMKKFKPKEPMYSMLNWGVVAHLEAMEEEVDLVVEEVNLYVIILVNKDTMPKIVKILHQRVDIAK